MGIYDVSFYYRDKTYNKVELCKICGDHPAYELDGPDFSLVLNVHLQRNHMSAMASEITSYLTIFFNNLASNAEHVHVMTSSYNTSTDIDSF